MSDENEFGDYHAEFAQFHEGYVRHYISFADNKAAVVFGVTSSLTAFLFANPAVRRLVANTPCEFASVLAVTTTICLLTSAGLAGWVIVPRMKNSGEGLIFFGQVNAYGKSAAYLRAVKAADEADLTEARINHCYDLSAICWRKYLVLRASMWSGFAGVALLILLTAITGL